MFRLRCTSISSNISRVSIEPCSSKVLTVSSSSFSAFPAASSGSLTGLRNFSGSSSSLNNNSTSSAFQFSSSCTGGSTGSMKGFSKVFRNQDLPSSFTKGFSTVFPANAFTSGAASPATFVTARRFNSSSTSGGEGEAKNNGGEQEGEGKAKEGAEGEEKEGGDKKKGDEKAEPKKSAFAAWKEDLAKHGDIYNVPNMMNLLIFTIFCLASTGSNVEADWWVNQWGTDGSLKPWTWVLHSWMTNNLPPMAFAMMLIHSMAHSVHANLGNAGLIRFVGITSLVSGIGMFALNNLIPEGTITNEKQFGPWDICAALMVMQYLHQGIGPIEILGGFQGWLRYASYVGAVCTLYYNCQPTLMGTVIGLALCKGGMFKAPPPPKM